MNKITVIGDTGSGKTSFLYAMYNFIAMGYVDGFTMSLTDETKDLELQQMYERLEDASLGEDRFPAASSKREVYQFSLQYGFKEIAPFQWSDYPGGYISSQGEGREEFVNDLKTSATWVIFLDGSKLCDAALEKDAAEKKKRILKICGKYTKFIGDNYKNIPSSVHIIVTKGDVIMNRLPEHFEQAGLGKDDAVEAAFKEIEKIIQTGISPLFVETQQTLVSISVVTLGDELTNNGCTGELDPKNIEYPITLSMLSILETRYKNVCNSISFVERCIKEDREKLFTSSKKHRDKLQNSIDSNLRPEMIECQKMVSAILNTMADDKKLWQGCRRGENGEIQGFELKAFYKRKYGL